MSLGRLAAKASLTRSQICRVEKDERPGVQVVAVGQIAAARTEPAARAAPAERVLWAEAADGRRWRL